jgi:hypothetical protein
MAKQEDRSWELVQIKAFTHWVNGVLEKRRLRIEKLDQDFRDGQLLVAFVEELVGAPLKEKYRKNPTSRVHMIENCHLAIMFLKKDHAIKNLSISAEDIADGNMKMLLGFLWQLFRVFRISKAVAGAENKSYEEGLLMWVRQTLANYPDLNIRDFSSSFADGKAFLALIHEFDQSFVEYNRYNKEEREVNVEAAFKLAEDKLHIPRLLEVKQVIGEKADERSVQLYVSMFLNAFQIQAEKSKLLADKGAIGSALKDMEAKLAMEESEKEEIKRQRADLDHRVHDLEAQLREEKKQHEETNKRNKSELDELRAQVNSLKDNETYLNEKVNVLKQMLDKETEEKTEIEALKESMERELAKLRAEKEQWAKEREGLQDERDAFEQDLKDMRDQLDLLKRTKEKLETKTKSRVDLEGRGLDTLRKNLLEHLKDMNTWKGYLEQDREYDSEKVQAKAEKEIITLAFEDQLEFLSGALADENKRLHDLLADHEAEEAEKKKQLAQEAKANNTA